MVKMKKLMALVTLAKEIQTKKINKTTFDNLEKLMNVELNNKCQHSTKKNDIQMYQLL